MQKIQLDFDHKEAENIEFPQQDSDTINIKQQSELGEVLDKAYQQADIRDKENNTSTIDFWSRIPKFVMPFIIRFEAAGRIGVIPMRSLEVPWTAKRNFISNEGQGRKEAVDIIGGKQQRDTDQSGFGAIKTWWKTRFGKGDQ